MSNILRKLSLKRIISLMFILSIVFLIFVFIKNPHKIISKSIYDESESVAIKDVSFPIVQNIKLNKDLMQKITIYFDDDSINNYNYSIKIYDVKNNIVFEQKYTDYESNIVLIDARKLKKNKNYKLIIDCDDCENVKMAIGKSVNKNNIIEKKKNDSLKMKIDNYEKNFLYYYIPIFIIFLMIVIILLSKIYVIDFFKNLQLTKIQIILYLLIIISLLLIIILFVKSPKKFVTTTVFDKNKIIDIENVEFPIKQNISLNKQDLSLITVFFGDSSINDFEYNIKVIDEFDNILSNHTYNNYESDIVLIDAGHLKSNKNYQLIIDCDDCENIKMAIGTSIDDKNKIEETKNSALKLFINNVEKDNNYYWYPLMIIAISLILLPFSRSKKV